ncbi:hypothetical protein, conserved [Eimeria necatrix]|uniref:Uncharacterized protein n=1 Tax=Eimeria necatrix TaxID=51315 RepID=U6MSK7_9EIME|nr:hypothetical protein, conserved [Eimeria necatrix]CDJ67187.1 hypothetical protein, conserved [Eimeria necatrix]
MQWRTDGAFFYSGAVLHAVLESDDEEADYREKIMAVKEGALVFFLDPKARDEEPTTVLRPHKTLSVSFSPNAFLISISYLPFPTRHEVHLVKLISEDELNRWLASWLAG